MCGTPARELHPVVLPRRSAFPSRRTAHRPTAPALRRPSARRAATSPSSPRRPTSVRSHRPRAEEFSCVTRASPPPQSAPLPRKRSVHSTSSHFGPLAQKRSTIIIQRSEGSAPRKSKEKEDSLPAGGRARNHKVVGTSVATEACGTQAGSAYEAFFST